MEIYFVLAFYLVVFFFLLISLSHTYSRQRTLPIQDAIIKYDSFPLPYSYSRKFTRNVPGRYYFVLAYLVNKIRINFKNPLCNDSAAWLHYCVFIALNVLEHLEKRKIVGKKRKKNNNDKTSSKKEEKEEEDNDNTSLYITKLLMDKKKTEEYIRILFSLHEGKQIISYDDYYNELHPNIGSGYEMNERIATAKVKYELIQ